MSAQPSKSLDAKIDDKDARFMFWMYSKLALKMSGECQLKLSSGAYFLRKLREN